MAEPVTEADRRLAAEGLARRRAGGKPNRQEAAAIRKIERAREEEDRWRYYRAVPQKHYREMSGRQTKVLNEQAIRHGIPCGGPVIDLAAVVRWVHDFLASHAHVLSRQNGEQIADPAKREDARYKRERTKLLRLRRQAKEGQLLRRSDVHEALMGIAAIYRRAGQRLRTQFGDEAYQIIEEGWDDVQRKIDHDFGVKDGEEKGNGQSKAKTKPKSKAK
jgi:hypothetical protein